MAGPTGLLGAFKQYLRDAMPGGALNPEVTRQGLLDSAAIATTPVPILGDAVGLAADAYRYTTDPSSRTPLNFGLSALGLIPFMPGLTVWHGSPHKFDKFDASKIGTGEGAQAYGHGLYLAESPKTAQWYAESLAGKQYSPSDLVSANGMTLKEVMKDAPPLARAKVTSYVNNAQGDMAKASADFDAFVQQQIRDNGALTDAGKSVLAEAQGWMRKLADAKISFTPKPTGNLYKVDLPDSAIEKMLDWDRKLSEQNPAVLDALKKTGAMKDYENIGNTAAAKVRELAGMQGVADWARRDLEGVAKELEGSKSANQVAGILKRMQLEFGINPDGGVFAPKAQSFLDFVKTTQYVPNMEQGSGLYGLLSAARGGDVAASEVLRKAGVPGLKYLDQGSRAATEGTRNFVVFPGEEGLLNILERNGQGLLGQ